MYLITFNIFYPKKQQPFYSNSGQPAIPGCEHHLKIPASIFRKEKRTELEKGILAETCQVAG
jgi:hypothetical protein